MHILTLLLLLPLTTAGAAAIPPDTDCDAAQHPCNTTSNFPYCSQSWIANMKAYDQSRATN